MPELLFVMMVSIDRLSDVEPNGSSSAATTTSIQNKLNGAGFFIAYGSVNLIE